MLYLLLLGCGLPKIGMAWVWYTEMEGLLKIHFMKLANMLTYVLLQSDHSLGCLGWPRTPKFMEASAASDNFQ